MEEEEEEEGGEAEVEEEEEEEPVRQEGRVYRLVNSAAGAVKDCG